MCRWTHLNVAKKHCSIYFRLGDCNAVLKRKLLQYIVTRVYDIMGGNSDDPERVYGV